MADTLSVAVIDDDEAVLDSLRRYLSRKGLAPVCFLSAEAFLAERANLGPLACVVTDVRMPGLSGLELVLILGGDTDPPPVILITGHGDIDMAVAAIKQGAADFIEKPFDEARLLEAIQSTSSKARQTQDDAAHLTELRARYGALSDRQRQVMELAANGLVNKEIGQRLGISPRTVEIHRAWMMNRMGARNLTELVRMEMELKAKR